MIVIKSVKPEMIIKVESKIYPVCILLNAFEIVETIEALPFGKYLSIIPWSILVHKNLPKL